MSKQNPITQTFRQTAAAAQLGRLIFDPKTQGSVSPAMILSLLQAAGLKVPKDVTIGVDVAQVLLSATVLAETIETASSIGSLMSGSLSLVGAVEGLLGAIGVLNFQDPNVLAVKMFGDGCLVISSLGSNVYEDIAFIFDMITYAMLPTISDIEHAQNQQMLPGMAKDWIKNHLSRESVVASGQFKDYQDKKISVFEMLGNIAMQSPDVFKNFYPDLAAFFPPVTVNHTVSAIQYSHIDDRGVHRKISESEAATYISAGLKVYTDDRQLPWHTSDLPQYADHNKFGYSQRGFDNYMVYDEAILKVEDDTSFSFQSISPDKVGLEKAFITKFLEEPFTPYRLLRSMTGAQKVANGYPANATKLGVFDHANPIIPRIRMEDLAILSMFPPYFEFLHDDFDLKRVLQSLELTVSDLNPAYQAQFFDNLDRGYYSAHEQIIPAGLTVNGLNIYSAPQYRYNKARAQNNDEIENVKKAEKAGNIFKVLKSPRADRIITEFGIMPYLPGTMEAALPTDYQKIPIDNPMGYRNIRNYWSAVSLKDTMKKDRFFADSFNNNVFSEIDNYLPDLSYFQENHRRLQALIIYRKFNQIARGHVARFFGTTADKLVMYPPEEGKLARVKQILK